MSVCEACKKDVSRTIYSTSDPRFLCIDCYGKPDPGWSKIEEIKSRARLPDGTILNKFQGQRINDQRLKAQERMEKHSLKYGQNNN